MMEGQALAKTLSKNIKQNFTDATNARTHKIDVRKLKKKFQPKPKTPTTPEEKEEYHDP